MSITNKRCYHGIVQVQGLLTRHSKGLNSSRSDRIVFCFTSRKTHISLCNSNWLSFSHDVGQKRSLNSKSGEKETAKSAKNINSDEKRDTERATNVSSVKDHNHTEANQHNHPWMTTSQIEAWRKQMGTTANKITFTRILFTPVLGYCIITDYNVLALGGCVLAAASDWVDGYLAKNHNQRTVLGTYLDPFADKVSIVTLSAALAYKEILPVEVVAIWFARDALLITGSYYMVRSKTKDGEAVMDPGKTPLQAEPTFISKVNTALQFLTICCGLSQPVFNLPDQELLTNLSWVTVGTTFLSGFSYLDGASLAVHRKAKQSHKTNNR